MIAMRRTEWDRALVYLKKAEKLKPKMTGVRLNIGLVKFRRGDYFGAIVPLQSVVRDQPDSFQARYLLGLSQLFIERYADAVAVLEPLWPQASGNFMYLYVIGIAAHNAGQKELDEKAMSKLVEVGGNTPEFHMIVGKAYLNREESKKSIAELEVAEKAAPNMPFLSTSAWGLLICSFRTINAPRRNSRRKLPSSRICRISTNTRRAVFETGAGCGGGEGVSRGVAAKSENAGFAVWLGENLSAAGEISAGVEGDR